LISNNVTVLIIKLATYAERIGIATHCQWRNDQRAETPSARKDDASPFRPFPPPGGLMELIDASLQRGRQG
jgi:hypothetical protein